MKFKTKEGTQKVDFWGPPILVLTRGCHLESDEISRKEGAQKVGFLGLQNTGPSRRGPKEIQILRVLIAYKKHVTMPWTLQNDICKASPLPPIGHPTGHKKAHKNAHVEKVLFLVQCPSITASFC